MAVSDQMDMALAESGRQDPVSGNDVPMGSLPEEVRDDVPAMLSEGEYVVPADVLRFYGLKFFEDLRENAKMEITRMADEGRIGGTPIAGPGPAAPTPDQPNGLDLSPEDMQQLESVLQSSEGGAVGFNVGGSMQEQAQKSGLPAKESSMNVPADTDMLIDRIMGAVQKNPALRQKLADKGVGFMQGGVVKAAKGMSIEDAIKAQSKYATKKFNPFDPNWMLGMSAAGLQDPLAGQAYGQNAEPVTAATIKETAGVIKPQPDGPDEDDPSRNPKGYHNMTASEVLAFGNTLDKFGLRDKWPGQKEAETIAREQTIAMVGNEKGKRGLDGDPTESGGGTAAPGAEATGSFTGYSSNANQGPAGGAGSGANDDGTSGTGGYGMFNKGGLASKKSKKGYDKDGYYTNKKMNTGGLIKKKKKK